MEKIHNCYNCNYMRNNKCTRKSKVNGDIIPIMISKRTIGLNCPCHSKVDIMKKKGIYIDDGLFNPKIERKLLLELEKIIINK